jgi:dTDP-glucose 4,6-dehydratase
MKKKIIVTGGLGFIGSNLNKLLIDRGFFVINIDKVSYASNFYDRHKKRRVKTRLFEFCFGSERLHSHT